MNAEKMSFDDSTFQSVLMFECLEHTYNPLKVLKEIHQFWLTMGFNTFNPQRLLLSIVSCVGHSGERFQSSIEHIWNWSVGDFEALGVIWISGGDVWDV